MRTKRLSFLATATCALAISFTTFSLADVVTLKNGDKLNGTIGTIAGGKMAFTSPVLGDLVISMDNVDSYTTDAPVPIRMKERAPTVTEAVKSGNAEKIETAGGTTISTTNVKAVNPSPTKWAGTVLFAGQLQRGNTDTLNVGLDAVAVYRRDTETIDDRFTMGGAYHFGTDGRGSNTTTTTDNWAAVGKYDYFWTEKFYTYATAKAEHDRIAALNYRLSPGVGVGYQWIETPAFNFFTEAGVSYVYEDYDPGDNNDFIALRLAYHVDKKLSDTVQVFHNLEWLPAFEDPGDYILTTDAGIRADLTKSFFSEFKIVYQRDSTPAPDQLKNDLKYILGIGWRF